jgi:hypothetical protein
MRPAAILGKQRYNGDLDSMRAGLLHVAYMAANLSCYLLLK